MKKLRIAQVAPLWKPVPPPKYGGVELVVSLLTEELVNQGHDVTLFASGNSRTKGKLIPILNKDLFSLKGKFNWETIEPEEFLLIHELSKWANGFDVIHFHGGIHLLAMAPLINTKLVTTYHSSVAPDFPLLADALKRNNFVSISDAQRKLAPEFNWVETIHHGIDVAKFKPNLTPQNYFCYLSTLSKAKGIDLAVKAAVDLNLNLVIAGDIRESEKEFLDHTVWPYVDGEKIKYIGEVNHQQKNTLLANARGMLFPTQWNEAFGLVMAEALACATPVIGYRNGAVPEVIKHGETGFVVQDYFHFLEEIKSIDKISRVECRQFAEVYLDKSTMVHKYLQLYQEL